ncbi:MAG TPA: FUSC family protein [Xanthobacteraceae bacterium]|nr:FUSC family protein [Xanthobacteraceae bacterium]
MAERWGGLNALRTFFSEVLGWSRKNAPEPSQIVTAMLGLAGPVAVGAITGHLADGMAAAIGGLALSGVVARETVRQHALDLIYALLAGAAAVLIGTMLARNATLTSVGVPVIAMVAGLLSSLGGGVARAAMQFVLFVIIATGIDMHGASPSGVTLLFLLGALWTAGLSLVLAPLFRTLRLDRAAVAAAAVAPSPPQARRDRMRRWWKSLAYLKGWQYALRLTLCLAAAELAALFWPRSHGYWIALTAAIVLGYRLPASPARIVQRAAGTLLGVVLAGALLVWSPPVWGVVAIIAVLAAARPVLKSGNYAAYAIIMTPLVILLLDLGQAPSAATLIDRLAATLTGCAISLLLGYFAWLRLIPKS